MTRRRVALVLGQLSLAGTAARNGVADAHLPDSADDVLELAYRRGFDAGYAAGRADAEPCRREVGGGPGPPATARLPRLTDAQAEAVGSLFCAEHICAAQLSPEISSLFARKVDPALNETNVVDVRETMSGVRRVRAAWSSDAAQMLRLPPGAVEQAWHRVDKWGACWGWPVLDHELAAAGAASIRRAVAAELERPSASRRFVGITENERRHDFPLPLSCVGEGTGHASGTGGVADGDDSGDELLCSVAPRLLERVVDAAAPILKRALGDGAVLVEAVGLCWGWRCCGLPLRRASPQDHATTNLTFSPPRPPPSWLVPRGSNSPALTLPSVAELADCSTRSSGSTTARRFQRVDVLDGARRGVGADAHGFRSAN